MILSHLYSFFIQCDKQSWALGRRQYCRDNLAMLSGHKVLCYCHITICVVATPSRHCDQNIVQIVSGL